MRRGNYGTGFVMGMLLALVVLIVAVPLIGNFFDKADESISSLQSCDGGMISALTGGTNAEARCFASNRCATSDGERLSEYDMIRDGQDPTAGYELVGGMQDSYYWQYVGKGWGCPDPEKGDKTNAEIGEGPFCCVKVNANKNPYSIGQITNTVHCSGDLKGQFRYVNGENCLEFDHEAVHLTGDGFAVRYYPTTESDPCTLAYTLQLEKNVDTMVEISGSVQCTRPYTDIAPFTLAKKDSRYDRAYLNAPGLLKIQVVGDGNQLVEKSFPFTGTREKYCAKSGGAGQCHGKPEGSVTGSIQTSQGFKEVMCVLQQDQTCTLSEDLFSSRTCPQVYSSSGSLNTDDGAPCRSATVPPDGCYVWLGTSWQNAIRPIGTYLCEPRAEGQGCIQTYLDGAAPSRVRIGGSPLQDVYEECLQ